MEMQCVSRRSGIFSDPKATYYDWLTECLGNSICMNVSVIHENHLLCIRQMIVILDLV